MRPNNNNIINNNINPDLSVSLSARAREDETDELTEKEFYADNILSRLKTLNDPYKFDYEHRLKEIVAELKRRETVTINGISIDTTEVLKAMVDLFRTPRNLQDIVFVGCKASVKKKFNYTVAALYNAARQF